MLLALPLMLLMQLALRLPLSLCSLRLLTKQQWKQTSSVACSEKTEALQLLPPFPRALQLHRHHQQLLQLQMRSEQGQHQH